ncbi:MAG: hypothetical protein QM621_03615 [Aeromicrobium sp.]|uniref:hypothetical protein n=1 Tax=Aeromicrobium sp. TaxID=1871063 RepID=UPI0039E3D3CA
MGYSDEELVAMASEYEQGITEHHLQGGEGVPGPLAWLLDVVTDWEAFAERARAEQTAPVELVRRAVDSYLRQGAA